MASRLLLAAALAVVCAPAALSQNTSLPFGAIISEQAVSSFTLLGSGARSAGMGGAFTAVADDATAASFNPAGLAQLLVPEASVAADWVHLKDDYTRFVSLDQPEVLPLTDSSIAFSHLGLNFASVTLPFQVARHQLAVQLSTQRLVDFTYDGTRSFRELEPDGATEADLQQTSTQSGSIRLYSASLAAQVTQRMLLGVTVNRWQGTWDFTSHNREKELDQPETFFLTYSQHNELSGWNVDAGLLMRYQHLNLGVRYRTPFTADYSFEAKLDTNLHPQIQPLPATKTSLRWPGTWHLGVAVKPSDRWLIAADWGQTNWARAEFDVPGAGSVSFFDLRPSGTTGATTASNWHVGTEVLFFLKGAVLPVRAGWFQEPQPNRDSVTGERVVGEGFTLGLGFKKGSLAVDAAANYSSSSTLVSRFAEPDQIASGDLPTASRGDLKRRRVSLFLSLIVQFPEDSAASRLLHDIFVGPREK